MKKLLSAGFVIMMILFFTLWEAVRPPQYNPILSKNEPLASGPILSTVLPTVPPPPENLDFLSQLDKKDQALMRPYFLYQDMTAHLSQTTPVTIDSFLKTYRDSPLSLTLRKQWLLYLADFTLTDLVRVFFYPNVTL